jgi:hypothetical protein
LDPLSLVFGALFAVMGAVFLLSDVSWSDWHAPWLWPVGVIALGAVLVALAPHDRSAKASEAAVDEDPAGVSN